MSWTDTTTTTAQVQYDDMSNIQILQQPVRQPLTLLQQLPAVTSVVPNPRTGGIREDLVELMMMQNAQMHQVIMNNMTMSALSTFGYTCTPELHKHTAQLEELDEDSAVHHYYSYSPDVSFYPALMHAYSPQLQMPNPVLPNVHSLQDPPHPPQRVHQQHKDRRAVPSPPPPSATGIVRADVAPAAEYNAAERRQQISEDNGMVTN